MNASQIITEEMTLDEKLAAIDIAMQVQQAQENKRRSAAGLASAPIDPADATMCIGCQ